jgi:glutamate racemase
MATPMTIAQRKFRDLVRTYENEADIVPLACEGLMEYVERGMEDEEELKKYLDENLKPVLTENTESIVLGCTHYPFISDEIRKYLGDDRIMLIDGSKGTSSQLKQRLADSGLLRDDGHKGEVTMLNSSDDPAMIDLSWRLFDEV